MKKVRLRVIKQFAVCPTVSLEVGIQTERSHPISGKAGVLYLGGSAGTSGSVAARKLKVRWTLSLWLELRYPTECLCSVSFQDLHVSDRSKCHLCSAFTLKTHVYT